MAEQDATSGASAPDGSGATPASPPSKPPGPGSAGESCCDRPHPCPDKAPEGERGGGDIDFATFVVSLATSAFIHLGKAPPLPGEEVAINLELAKQTIDILGMLEQKTRCNLTEREASLLQQILFDLRMQFIEASTGDA